MPKIEVGQTDLSNERMGLEKQVAVMREILSVFPTGQAVGRAKAGRSGRQPRPI